MKYVTTKINNEKKAFTLVEVLITLIILTILTMILVPRLTERTERARVTAAASDIRALERAQSSVEIDTGYFVRLFVLNDSRREENGNNQENNLFQYPPTIEYAIDPETGLLLEVDLSNETIYDWYGPYITYDKVWDDQFDEQDNPYRQIPLDPWGMPYLLFTHRGLVEERGEPQGFIEETHDQFNQMTILSTGPDRSPGDREEDDDEYGAPDSDDIYRSF